MLRTVFSILIWLKRMAIPNQVLCYETLCSITSGSEVLDGKVESNVGEDI